ncbi:hypothetical protein ACLOAV_010161 [Pseudogymnoascus australis]
MDDKSTYYGSVPLDYEWDLPEELLIIFSLLKKEVVDHSRTDFYPCELYADPDTRIFISHHREKLSVLKNLQNGLTQAHSPTSAPPAQRFNHANIWKSAKTTLRPFFTTPEHMSLLADKKLGKS